MVSDKMIHEAFRIHNSIHKAHYNPPPPFFFTIYQNFTLALTFWIDTACIWPKKQPGDQQLFQYSVRAWPIRIVCIALGHICCNRWIWLGDLSYNVHVYMKIIGLLHSTMSAQCHSSLDDQSKATSFAIHIQCDSNLWIWIKKVCAFSMEIYLTTYASTCILDKIHIWWSLLSPNPMWIVCEGQNAHHYKYLYGCSGLNWILQSETRQKQHKMMAQVKMICIERIFIIPSKVW